MSLAQSLNDTKTAVNELHRIVSVVVAIIIITVWLLMLGIASTKVLLLTGTQLLLLGFMFGNTLKQLFEAIIFLFVMHPFDVGDRCIVDGVQVMIDSVYSL
jgi:small-conductance mechanosensitive channel